MSRRRGGVISLLAICCLIVFLSITHSEVSEWGVSQLIDNNSPGNEPQISIFGSTVVAVWSQYDSGNYRIYTNRSINGGATWRDTQLIGASGSSPQVASSGSIVVAVWGSVGASARIYSSRSTNGGVTWGAAQLIENNIGQSASSPQIAISGSTVVAVWAQTVGATWRIYSNRSTDGGTTWGAAQLIENNIGRTGYEPQIAISGSTVVTVWTQYDGAIYRIYSNRSTNGGATWGGAQLIDNTGINGGINGTGGTPQVAISGSTVIAFWSQDYKNTLDWPPTMTKYIFANRSTDGGGTWGFAKLIQYDVGQSANPQVAISGSTIVAVWSDPYTYPWPNQTPVHTRIYAIQSADGGVTWTYGGAFLIENNGNYDGSNPQVAISGSAIVAVWSQPTRIYSNQSPDGGTTWRGAQLIENNNLMTGANPQVAISGSTVVAVWSQFDNVHGGIYSNRIVVAETSLPVAKLVIASDTRWTGNAPTSASDIFVQINLRGGNRIDGPLKNKVSSIVTGASYIGTTTLLYPLDAATIPIWTNQSSMSLFIGIRNDTQNIIINSLPRGIPATDTGRAVFGRSIILVEFADSTGKLIGNSRTTSYIGDSFAYTIIYSFSAATTALYNALGFNTAPGSNSFRFYYADMYGGAWLEDTTVTISVTAGTSPGAMTVSVSGITKDLPGGLGGGATLSSSISGREPPACIISNLIPNNTLMVIFRTWRDLLLNFFAGRMFVQAYYGLSAL